VDGEAGCNLYPARIVIRGMRTIDVIYAELRLLVVIRKAAREAGGRPSTAAVDELPKNYRTGRGLLTGHQRGPQLGH
jgi:hypothetical protein